MTEKMYKVSYKLYGSHSIMANSPEEATLELKALKDSDLIDGLAYDYNQRLQEESIEIVEVEREEE